MIVFRKLFLMQLFSQCIINKKINFKKHESKKPQKHKLAMVENSILELKKVLKN